MCNLEYPGRKMRFNTRITFSRWEKFYFTLCALALVWVVISGIQLSRYNYDSFNCWNMAWELKYSCDRVGIPCEVVVGDHKNPTGSITERHAWVRILGVDFEATLLCPCVNSFTWDVESKSMMYL